MASSSSSSNLAVFILTVVFLFLSLPILHARDIHFFSKTTHANPSSNTAVNQLPNSNNDDLSSIPEQPQQPLKGYNDDQSQGYGLYGRGGGVRNTAGATEDEETYQYKPTTSNPTVGKSSSNYNNNNAAVVPEFQRDSYSVANEDGYIGNRWTGQGMMRDNTKNEGRLKQYYSFDGSERMRKKQPRFSAEDEVERGSHGEIYNTNNNGNKNRFDGTVERQGMSDTRFLENGKYYHDISNEDSKYDDTAFDSKNNNNNNNNNDDKDEEEEEKYDLDVEEEDGHDKMYQYHNNNLNQNQNQNMYMNYNGKKQQQGMSDTRYMGKGKYFYDINNEKNVNRDEGFGNNNMNVNHQNLENRMNHLDKSNDAASASASAAAGGQYDFRNTVNKFPKYEFDSMEEYMKQNGYNP